MGAGRWRYAWIATTVGILLVSLAFGSKYF